MSTQTPEFKPFGRIPRLKRECIITEKIDGTNALVWVDDDVTQVRAGSRNRWITPEDDNYGFAGWVAANERELLRLGPGYHYGEWWGKGIQRGYWMNEKRFSLFNTGRWSHAGRPSCCGTVPILHVGQFTTEIVDNTLGALRRSGSIAAPGFMDPEGVVVLLPASGTLHKVTLGNDGHKGAR